MSSAPTDNPADDPAARPLLRLLPGHDKRAAAGYPWIFANEVTLDEAARAWPAGGLVTLTRADGRPLGPATFNLHSLICARLFGSDPAEAVDEAFFRRRLEAALDLRTRLYDQPFYRLIHAEADRLPGFIVDRFGEALVVQANTAGAERHLDLLISALDALLAPQTIVLRNDSPARGLEGLEREVRLLRGAITGPLKLEENGTLYLADPLGGQKTGWFYDLRAARALIARLARSGRLLDVYSHTGAFALAAAVAGAAQVTAVDRSGEALALAEPAAALNGVAARCRFVVAEAFAYLEQGAARAERYEVVVADPPSFVKAKRELKSGLKGYRKLARLAAPLVAPGGFLFIGCCSHHVEAEPFAEEVARGLVAAGREGRILASGGAGSDHPVHPLLPESAYLKWQVLQLD